MKPKFSFAGFLLTFSSSALLFSCTHEPDNIYDLDPVCFDSQVLPIIQTSCGISGCHDGTQEGFLATDYQSIMNSVSPGDPRKSTLYKVITDINSDNMMPPDRPLTKQQRNIIQVWIAQGADEILCDGGPPALEVCFVQDILPMMVSTCGSAGCHDAITHSEGYVLTSYATITNKGIVPFHPNASEIYNVVTETGEDKMPPSPRTPLSAAQINALRLWISSGAENTDCPPASCDSSGTILFSTQVNPILVNSCTGCHNNSVSSGGINLSGYNNVFTTVQLQRSGTPVILGSVKRLQGFTAMPPSYALDECKVAILQHWIEQGANNN